MPDEFAGFYAPLYTQVPDQLFDELLPDLTGAELKCLLYIIRRTFGFKKISDRISISQLTVGITKRDGDVLDRGTGLHRATVITALQGLQHKGIIVAQDNLTPDGGTAEKTYSLKLISTPPSRKKRPSPVAKDDRGEPEYPAGWAGKSDPQETDLQEIEQQETEPSKFENPDPTAKTDEDRETLASYVEDVAREFGDEARLSSSVTRTVRLYRRSGRSLEDFVGAVYQARALTKEHLASIKADRRPGRPKRAMPYYFAVLEDLLGLKPPAPVG